MAKMLAAVWHGPGEENFKLEYVDRPSVGSTDILVKVKSCCFGAVQMRAIRTGHPKFTPPVIGAMGRTVSGDIAEVGDNVDTENIEKGMRVAINPEAVCHKCYFCRIGEYPHCEDIETYYPGGLAEYILVPKRLLPGVLKIPKNVSYEEASYTEILACCIYGIMRSNLKIGDTIVIIGAGNVGLTWVQLAKMKGASKIISMDVFDERLELASKLGATDTINVGNTNIIKEIKSLTEGRGADVVVEAVGSAKTYKQALHLVRPGGNVIGFGGCPPGSKVMVDPNLIHYKSIKFIGHYHYTPDLFHRALQLIINQQVDLKPIITNRIPLAKIHEAIKIYGRPDVLTIFINP
jgi:L-iditol 2-dehydrogenase